jgi:mannan endo-1,4-beta-mannosidase
MNIWCRNETDWCSGNSVTVSTTQTQQVDTYDSWINAANSAGVNIIHYQWGQENLTAAPGGAIRPQNTTTTSPVGTTNTIGVSPDDGYAT